MLDTRTTRDRGMLRSCLHRLLANTTLQFHRRLFVLDRQVDALQRDSMWKIGSWLARRFHNAEGREEAVKVVLDLATLPRKVIEQEWYAQVAAQLVKPPRTLTFQFAGLRTDSS